MGRGCTSFPEERSYRQGSRRWLGWMRRPEPERLTDGSIRYGIPAEDPADPRVIYAVGWAIRGESMKLNKQTGLFEPYLDRISAETLDYSPDGQWIAYVSFPELELWKCRRDGSDRVLLEDDLRAFVPRWSPDGKRLAFMAAGMRLQRSFPDLYHSGGRRQGRTGEGRARSRGLIRIGLPTARSWYSHRRPRRTLRSRIDTSRS